MLIAFSPCVILELLFFCMGVSLRISHAQNLFNPIANEMKCILEWQIGAKDDPTLRVFLFP